MKELLLDENKDGEIILQYALKNVDSVKATIQMLWDVMQQLLDIQTLKQILTKRNKSGKTCLKVAQETDKLDLFISFVRENNVEF